MAKVNGESKSVTISKLLKSLGKLLGTSSEARSIRAKLRSLGHYLSKQKPATAKVKTQKAKKTKVVKAAPKKRRDPDADSR